MESGAEASPTSETTTPETPESTTNDTTTLESGSDDHSHGGDGHSHGDDADSETTAETNDTTTSTDTSGDDAATGKATLVVEGTELDLQSLDEDGDGFGIAADDEHTWVTQQSNLTLADSLSRFDVEANAQTLAFDGETYREDTEGTDIVYRVDGEPVDPESYEVSNGDQIWVLVTTDEMNASTPGTYIDHEQQHAHGPMTMSIEGDTIDFSQEKYQSNHRYFHFEGGNGEEWHAHSWSVTLEYALSSLSGINVSDDTLTYDGTTYDRNDPDTTVTFEVNGEPVEPGEYYLKDGDSIRVVVETEGS